MCYIVSVVLLEENKSFIPGGPIYHFLTQDGVVNYSSTLPQSHLLLLPLHWVYKEVHTESLSALLHKPPRLKSSKLAATLSQKLSVYI